MLYQFTIGIIFRRMISIIGVLMFDGCTQSLSYPTALYGTRNIFGSY